MSLEDTPPPHKNESVLNQYQQIPRSCLPSLRPHKSGRARKDCRGDTWWSDLPVLDPSYHASGHQALEHPRQLARFHQAMRLRRVRRAHQLDRRHIRRHIHVYGPRANPGREVHGQVGRLEFRPQHHGAGYRQVPLRRERAAFGRRRRAGRYPGSSPADRPRARPETPQERCIPAYPGRHDPEVPVQATRSAAHTAGTLRK
jgi:hypothetical protein